jgi:Brp/Blh family beta-carotene 15,15'-monooxygenase
MTSPRRYASCDLLPSPRSALYPLLLSGLLLAIAVARSALPTASSRAALDAAVLLPAFAGLGVPHGALDHLVAAAIRTISISSRPPRSFYIWYLSLAGVYAIVWCVAPAVAAACFLLLTALHFGETDLEALSAASARVGEALPNRGSSLSGSGPPSPREWVLTWLHTAAYGAAVLTSLLTVDPAASLGTAAALQVLPAALVQEAASSWSRRPLLLLSVALPAAALAAALAHPTVVAVVRPSPRHDKDETEARRRRWLAFSTLLASLAAVGVLCGAALPLATYFCGWHAVQSFAHIAATVAPQQVMTPPASCCDGVGCTMEAGRYGLLAWLRRRAVQRRRENVMWWARADSSDTRERHAALNGCGAVAEGRALTVEVCACSAGAAWEALSAWTDTRPAPKARARWLWLDAMPLTVAALLSLPTLVQVLPPSLPPAGDGAFALPVPPPLLVLIAVLTLPHAKVMHASYLAVAWAAERPTEEAQDPSAGRELVCDTSADWCICDCRVRGRPTSTMDQSALHRHRIAAANSLVDSA